MNMYEDYPFWHAFFTKLGYRVLLSSEQLRDIPTEAMETIPSYSNASLPSWPMPMCMTWPKNM